MKLKLHNRQAIFVCTLLVCFGLVAWGLFAAQMNAFSYRVDALQTQFIEQAGSEALAADQTALDYAIAQTKSRSIAVFLVSMVLLIIAIAGVIFKSTKLAARPIRELVRYAEDISRGDYERKVTTYRDDELGRLASFLDSMSDDLRQRSDRVRYLAYHDGLTGLPNREMVREYLDFYLKNASIIGQNVIVMFIDLDDFKVVNDTLGHDAGDWLLKEVAERIKGCIRKDDYVGNKDNVVEAVVSRHGGDEFTLILPHVREPMNASIVARRIIEAVSAPFVIKGQEVFVGASIGIAAFPSNGTTVDILLKNADIAMYQAKQDGKNVYKFYSDTMNIRALHKLSLETDLRKALDRGEMQLWYQPQIDLSNGRLIGAEALLRWAHPKRGIVMPNEFIPMAERLGVITDLGEWVIRSACRQAKAWHQTVMQQANISVNVSSVQFRRQDVATVVDMALKMADIPAKLLHLEVTETGLFLGDRKALQVLKSLKDLGIEVWIDDFGTGYSSLNYLRQFPVSGVKIDRSFVKDVDSKDSEKALVSAIISMCHSLGLRVTAEGVETKEQLQLLSELKCDYVQGHIIGKAMTPERFEKIFGPNGVSSDEKLKTEFEATQTIA